MKWLIGFIASVLAAGLATTPCPMAHCSPGLQDQVAAVPLSSAAFAWQAATNNGVGFGLGAVVGPDFVAVSFSKKAPYLQVFNLNGTLRWTANTGKLERCAPLVGEDGSVYVADGSSVYRFNGATGAQIWKVSNPSGQQPFSLNLTSEGLLIGAGNTPVVWALQQATGALVDTVSMSDGTGSYVTVNTPAVSGTRVYVATNRSGVASAGRLYAIDTAGGSLSIAWYYGFTGPTGGSPTVSGDRIYFDGRGGGLWMHGVQDTGPSPLLLWSTNMLPLCGGCVDLQMSPAIDPRGGVQVVSLGGSRIVRLDELTGQVLQSIDLDALLGAGNDTANVLTIAGDTGYLVSDGGTNRVLGIDLVNETLRWQYAIGGSISYGQIPSQSGKVFVPLSSGGLLALQ